MEQFMDAHANKNSMPGNRVIPPFFFPKGNPTGPNIVFSIRINGDLFPVFVQLKLRKILSAAQVKYAASTVSAPKIERHATGSRRFCLSNNTFISIIVAYPAGVVDKLKRPAPSYDLSRLLPRTASKSTYLTQVRILIDQSNIGEIFPKDHVDFIDRIRGPGKLTEGQER